MRLYSHCRRASVAVASSSGTDWSTRVSESASVAPDGDLDQDAGLPTGSKRRWPHVTMRPHPPKPNDRYCAMLDDIPMAA